MFLHVSVSHSVHRGGGAIQACIAGGIPVCLAGGALGGGGDPPPSESRQLLLRTVRILLECILVEFIFIHSLFIDYDISQSTVTFKLDYKLVLSCVSLSSPLLKRGMNLLCLYMQILSACSK